jgi:two-component sensor histidine kinase/ActR/RegA family two-component response regulator
MPNRKPRILIIDDDQGFCKLASKHFERADFDVVCANTATEGLAYLRDHNADVIVLDHILPEHDGLTLLASIQAHFGAPPVVYLTGSQESRVAVSALKAGAADYVVKDLHGDFLLLLENAVTNAMFATAIKRDKEKAEAEVRTARDQFKALAEERALLLREVNHRVSNSLQLIASLLHFQGDVSGNTDVKAALKEAIGRVLAVARVHRSLYTSFDVRWVSLADYVASLIHDLDDVTADGNGGVNTITFSADRIQAGPDTAVAVGIVLTELVLNALKHAYPGGRGPVRVRLQAKASEIELSVEDDGVGGLHEQGDRQRPGLGQRIIGGMADKIDGTLRYEKLKSGTRAVMTFPFREDIRLLAAEPETATP